ncbi:IS481 family transposase [Mycobacterium colombiense]|uniref:Integrase catalytic subunit n=1 Tax=Mycobacterium colombiense CECT 3035 TaxID=1041522 RepID=J4THU7_9MYCO|nr:IS481 family transposase [Mycobacterium colombiense]EJO88479.1 integrase catalytic subunit [Mycobacterium colombiense CECT 3035]EJO88973.1 integrase catalytic subunit [Mycobacterium colombiense CECT 3035]EJO89948.1 integrase catalytic subunit [Mycobacterium colombiense CECT 3035]
MSHRNAPLSETGRLRLARCVVEDGWPLRRAAERFQVSATTAWRWADRYRTLGAAGMVDRSSRPHRSPQRTPTRTERRIIKVRVLRRWGPARIGYLLGIHPSTVHRVLTRYGMAKLRWLDRCTGRVVRRMEPASCGDMVHVDVKKLGKIPAGGGWRMLGRIAGNHNTRADKSSGQRSKHGDPLHGHHFLHTAIDGYSRLAYSELLSDERQHTAAAFWARANAWFTECGITVRKVLTDNGSCYRSHTFREALAGIEHRRTRPYRPQTNGKVERFHRTLADEWAYARLYRSDTERCEEFPRWLHTYNHHRGHTALGGQPPASRVLNLSGQYS